MTSTKRLAWISAVSAPAGDASGLSITQAVAFFARASSPENQRNVETMPKLLKYLIDNNHWSPFEQVSITVGMTLDRSIARQVLRHRSFAFSEVSQRYASLSSDVEPIVWEARLAGATNRQGSIETDDALFHAQWIEHQMYVWRAATYAYEWAVDKGMAPEVARAVLPEGMTPTTLYMAGTLRSWIHYLGQRLDLHAQKEHRELAQVMRAAMIENSPDLEAILPKGD